MDEQPPAFRVLLARRSAAWPIIAVLLAAIPAEAFASFSCEAGRRGPEEALFVLSPRSFLCEDGPARPPEKRLWLSLAEVTAINLLIWSIDRLARDQDWARVGPSTWEKNLSEGPTWDTDRFDVNELAHSYQGALFFDAARANGFGYWESAPFAVFGILQWELFLENARPSINDLINTPLGGMVVGESLHRFSSLVLDNRASGADRLGHELLAGLIDPVRGINRLLTGEAWENGSNPPEWRPLYLGLVARAGGLTLGGTGGPSRLVVEAAIDYGDPFRSQILEPFDAFRFDLRFGGAEDRLVRRLDIAGILAAGTLAADDADQSIVAALQELDYSDTPSYKLGAQVFSAALLFRHSLPEERDLRLALSLRGLALAAVSSEYSQVADRTYDFGPGLGLRAELWYGRWPWGFAQLGGAYSWVHSANGSRADHLLGQLGLQIDVPVYRFLGIGASFDVFRRDSLYADFPNVGETTLELRLFFSLH